MDSLRNIIAAELSRHAHGVSPAMIKEVPPEIVADFAFPCFAQAKAEKRLPKAVAEELAKKLNESKRSSVPSLGSSVEDRRPKTGDSQAPHGLGGGLIERAEAKEGFVNVTINPGPLASKLLPEIIEAKDSYGKGKRQGKLIVEHTSANPDAPLHVGHIRNSIIGDSMVRVLRFAGYDASSQFFINDMGGQLALLATYLNKLDYSGDLKRSKQKPDIWIGEKYVIANKEVDPVMAKALQGNYERGGKDIRKVFDFIVDTCISGFKETFKSYNIQLDSYVRESEFMFGGKVGEVLEKLQKTSNWFEKDGVAAVDLEKYGIKKELVLLRSDGTTLYTTRDIAYHLWKLEQGGCINVIANEQTFQQQQLRAALDILGVKDVEKRVRHLSYELVTVPGMRMSSRTGEFISADDLLKEGKERAREEIDQRNLDVPEPEKDNIANAVAIGAIRFNIVRINPLKPIEFKWEEAINFEGESAPYIQYSHARACRILEKAGKPKDADISKASYTAEERKLLILLSQFPEAVDAAALDLKPNLVANYLYTLAEAFNRFYFKCPVIDSQEPEKSARIMIVKAFKQVAANGLKVLGIEPLERM